METSPIKQESRWPNPDWMDAHCHLADPRYSDLSLRAVIERSRAAHVRGWIQGGYSPKDWDRQIWLQQQYGPGVVTSFGLHPWWVAQASREDIENGITLLRDRGQYSQAIGELGLDFLPKFKSSEQLKQQYLAFELQLTIAKELKKPVILHIVKAHSEALKVLKRMGPFPYGGIVHAFSGPQETALAYLSFGFLISISGAITRKGFRSLKESISTLPLDRIVIETDSPDQMPILPGLNQEKLNEPANLIGVAKCLAKLTHGDYEEALSKSTDNLKRLFGLI